ncbi:sulfite exporter TauE/SafE family protein [Gayadomonas joobiniege]|uniref:sulfite exporter TauE/SafE family protein n=1 Tax=Gayadomonas joobiniege TaxID=1234606 RepID=UPI00036CE45F|nr:sulfite exporter TauE/SafE family protein [Gayadomonas joobiniege]
MSDYITAFILGLTGAGHCIAMCGGLSIATGLQKHWFYLLSYHSGRIFSYACAGFIFALLSQTFSQAFSPLLIILKFLAAVLLVLLACYLGRWNMSLVKLEHLFAPIWKKMSPYANQALLNKAWYARFFAGILWGWLPCGLVYSVLTFATASGDALKGALIMLFFGLGTWPALFLSASLGHQMNLFLNKSSSRFILALLLLSYGIFNFYQAVMMTLAT